MLSNFIYVLRTDPGPLVVMMGGMLLCYYLAKWGRKIR